MLKELRITNLILISSANISFDRGFNVLSGETGAGKSAIIKALHLLAGDKVDASIIRHGADKAIVEGLFDIDHTPEATAFLKQFHLDHEEGEELIIRREITQTGRGRCTVNNQLIQQALLRKLGHLLFEMVGQHANQKLLLLDQHRYLVDLYGAHLDEANAFAKSWEKENRLAKELRDLIKNEAQRLRDIEVCQQELEELNEANLKEGEEEVLFKEYSRLSNADEIASKVDEISQVLNGEKASVLSALKRQTHHFEQLVRLDPSFEECAQSHKNALMELLEVAYVLEKFDGHGDHRQEHLESLNERLTLITKLKRKYGETISAITAYKEETAHKLNTLESADIQIEDGKAELATLKGYNQHSAAALSTKRRASAQELAQKLTEQLRTLNMPKVQFEIDLSSSLRSSLGDDQIEFFLTPNTGERRIPIKEHASGGELSRILLALHTLLAGKGAIATLIFDEIDANIGGATSVVVGEKLRAIGQQHQVLCITHFPQVAKHADHHIQIEKREEEGRTFSHIARLDAGGRKKELARMSGLPS